MKVLIFGATGMVGQGILRESLAAEEVTLVGTVGRTATGLRHPKLREMVHGDLQDLSAMEPDLAGFDACFFCLGVSSAGLDEAAYTRVTHDLALAVAAPLARLNPSMTFVFVSGAGTDSTGQGRTMWARVKGRTENDLARLPFKAVYAFRPAFIQPLHGIRSRTRAYRVLYALMAPLMPLLRLLLPRQILTTETLAQAMLEAAGHGAPTQVLEAPALVALSERYASRTRLSS